MFTVDVKQQYNNNNNNKNTANYMLSFYLESYYLFLKRSMNKGINRVNVLLCKILNKPVSFFLTRQPCQYYRAATRSEFSSYTQAYPLSRARNKSDLSLHMNFNMKLRMITVELHIQFTCTELLSMNKLMITLKSKVIYQYGRTYIDNFQLR